MNDQKLFENLRKSTFPNQELSKAFTEQIVEGKSLDTIANLSRAITGEDKMVALFSSDILAGVSRLNPSLIENELGQVIRIFTEKRESQLLNNCLDILIALAPKHHIEIYQATALISEQLVYEDLKIMDKLIELLAVLAKYSAENHLEICMIIKIVITDCAPSDFVRYTEKILPAIDKTNCREFQSILLKRKPELNDLDQKKIDAILGDIFF